ncbi:MAG: UDP-N-acetylglucosamine diphosphorylase/glucosamine-1-phosphate N-acetyltransferase, partial [Zetaproteobacteria bacterium]
VLHAVEQLSPAGIAVVVGEHEAKIRKALGDPANLDWARQPTPRGTADAVLAAKGTVRADVKDVLILQGDTPLVRAETLVKLVEARRRADADLALLSAVVDNPHGYGRIVRDADGEVAAIVEEADADERTRRIREINAGVYCAKAPDVFAWLEEVRPENAQREFYLTDLVRVLVGRDGIVVAVPADDADEALGVNDRVQLAAAEKRLQRRVIEEWQRQGVTIEQPETVRIELGVSLGMDCVVHAGTQLLGSTHIGEGCEIGPYAIVRDAWLDDEVKVLAFSVVEGPETEIASGVRIGPFARIRPGTHLAEDVRIGNFVEVKNSVIGRGTKANHLSYLGDAEIGEFCNIGAGTITCNYDGANKHKTIIEDDVFIGSDTKLVAPVRVGRGATIGAGSLITKDVKPGGLTLTERPDPRHFPDWRRPRKVKR